MSTAWQAIVLAAGRGSRLGAEGELLPKCLLPLAGKPLLSWTLSALRVCGVGCVRMVAGWRAEQLAALGLPTRLNARWEHTGVVRSMLCADDWLLHAPTLLLYGDGAYSSRVLGEVLHGGEADLLVAGDRCWSSLWQRRFADPLSDAESWRSRGGLLTAIGDRATAVDEIEAQFMGLLRITPEGWRQLRARLMRWEGSDGGIAIDRMDMTAMLQRLVDEGVPVACMTVAGGWVEIDTLSDRDAAEQGLQETDFAHDFR